MVSARVDAASVSILLVFLEAVSVLLGTLQAVTFYHIILQTPSNACILLPVVSKISHYETFQNRPGAVGVSKSFLDESAASLPSGL